MIKIISKSSHAIENEAISAEEMLYISTTLGGALRSFGDEVRGATVRFDEGNSGEWVCNIRVETGAAPVEVETCAPSKAAAVARAAEVLDRQIFSNTFGSLSRAA